MKTSTIRSFLPTSNQRVDESRGEIADAKWQSLYKVGGVAALVTAALVVTGVITFVAWPPPPPEAPVTDWFALFQRNWFVGMLSLDLVMLASYIVIIPLLLALYVALRRCSEVLMALATAFGLVGTATYFASSRVFEMLALSQQYAAATTEAQRASLVTIGQSMLITYLGSFAAPASLSVWNYQGTAFNVSFVFFSVACLIIAVVMLRSDSFGKVIGYVGIVAYMTTLGFFAPVVGLWLSLVGLVMQLAWYILVARALFRLAHRMDEVPDTQHTSAAGRAASLATR